MFYVLSTVLLFLNNCALTQVQPTAKLVMLQKKNKIKAKFVKCILIPKYSFQGFCQFAFTELLGE